MELSPYVETLRNDLAVAAEAGGTEARALAERLTAPLESALRLVLLDALSAAAAEITRDLAPGSVDLRLRGREPSFVVTPPPADPTFGEPEAATADVSQRVPPDGEDGTMARINLRLAEDLKSRVEDAARQAGLSVNAWLVRSAAAALATDDRGGRSGRRAPWGGDRHTGWVR
ncbi:MAG: hypothetical protein H0V10_07560 [Geodermatophilaceae bacterium]|nr:hypothetical protein [Geodermatophilaceae bacterium]